MAKHHSSIVGGSTAGRLLGCPGSYQATAALPPSAAISSEYAEEGTAMHAVMDELLRVRQQGIEPAALPGVARSWVTREFYDRKLTYEHYDTMILPALSHLGELERLYGGSFTVAGIEQRVRFPGVPGAFGTIDLILQSPNYVLHVDWKFGQGVGVSAVYSDGEGAIVNPQLMFYLTAARKTLPRLYGGKRGMVVAIIQPRGGEPLTYTDVDKREIKQFGEDVENAVIAAMERNPVRIRGEHCRFAPCKVNCPLWTGPLLDLTALGSPPEQSPVRSAVTPYGAYLAKAKLLVDSMVMIKGEVDKQMHAYLESGGVVPGWRLKAKVKQRQWVDVDTVFKTLRKLGFEEHEIMTSKLVTFQQADAAARTRGVTIPDDLRVAPPSTETTIATTSDPAPVVSPSDVIEQFSAALKQLTEPT